VGTPYLSEIKLFAFGFPPHGWAACNGQLLPINQNQALFALLGTTYGGNGTTNFALPDLRGRVPACASNPLDFTKLGQQGGVETVTLVAAEMPAHTHVVDPSQLKATLPCTDAVANQRSPVGHVPAVELSGVTATYSSDAPDAIEHASTIVPAITAANAGSGTAHQNMQPYTVMNYCIALQGIFPSRA
jgi:microcystin-dependent protein